MPKIHPTAVVDPQAEIADSVEIGPMCYVGPNVKLGGGCRLIAQCNVEGYTTLGENNTLYPFSALGQNAQDLSVEGGKTYLNIGDGNTFREGVCVHTGTKPDSETVIGNDCYFMNNTHVAHNCKVGNNVIMVGGASLAGYCEIGDRAIMSGFSGMHQFGRVGRLAMLSACSVFSQDIAPFMIAEGRNGPVRGVNVVGCKRAGISMAAIKALRDVYKIFFRSGLNSKNAVEKIEADIERLPEVQEFLDFLASSSRGVHQGRTPGRRA
ncbi:acyl-ACP--UDP-N-acetylglucosamine O-acyltransferase [Lentisphaerota bacterium ZTH]|nr:acyl-ACP--UDP-N-acetylglucosamine O-acyltransferase [Lentisphaerota bacterium]WET05298.1 acyl-ACP--UDP-N-acetylglucosamine O-acyltransferase [Lentisphaerota bacterium ZTH]